MGCDIHLYAEKRVDGQWLSADEWETDGDYAGSIRPGRAFYNGRNYSLFSMLAGVRNYYDIEPFEEPRGFPIDASPEVVKAFCCEVDEDHDEAQLESYVEKYGCARFSATAVQCPDWHTPSWFTLADLLAFDWTQQTHHVAWVDGPTYEQWNRWERQHGKGPSQYCQSVGGGSTRHVNETELQAAIDAIKQQHAGPSGWQKMQQAVKEQLWSTYAKVGWSEPYHQCATEFWGQCIPRLLRLGTPDDVRIVFWFDN